MEKCREADRKEAAEEASVEEKIRMRKKEKAKKSNRKRGRAHLNSDVPGSAGHQGEGDSRS